MAAPSSVRDLFKAAGNAAIIDEPNRYPLNAGLRVVTTRDLNAGQLLVVERGLAVAITDDACPICFGSHPKKDDPAFELCHQLAQLLQPVEGKLQPDLKALLEVHADVDGSVGQLWLRLAAVACIPGEELSDECRQVLHQWRAAIMAGLAHQQTSAPDQAWLLNMAMFASDFTDLLPEPATARFAELLLPPLRSSGLLKDDGTVVEALILVAGQLNRNGYSLRQLTDPNTLVAHGIFPAIAMLNHSCHPNCVVVTQLNGHLAVKVSQPIRAGSECFVSYVDILLPRHQRQATLKANKEFDCTCMRCIDPSSFPAEFKLDSIKCPNCHQSTLKAAGERYVCFSELGGCSACFASTVVTKLRLAAVAELSAVQADKDLSTLSRAITTAETVLTSQAIELQRAHMLAFGLAAKEKVWHTAAHHLDSCIAGMQPLVPTVWPELHQLQVLSAMAWNSAGEGDCSNAKAKDTARQRIMAARKQLRKVYTTDHPLMAQLEVVLASI